MAETTWMKTDTDKHTLRVYGFIIYIYELQNIFVCTSWHSDIYNMYKYVQWEEWPQVDQSLTKVGQGVT